MNKIQTGLATLLMTLTYSCANNDSKIEKINLEPKLQMMHLELGKEYKIPGNEFGACLIYNGIVCESATITTVLPSGYSKGTACIDTSIKEFELDDRYYKVMAISADKLILENTFKQE